MGPGVRQNVVVDRPVDSTDLIPTLGKLLGFDAPLFAGQAAGGGGIGMLPNQLAAENFQAYPVEAKRLAVRHLTLLRRLPLGFVPLLLREVIVYDWKFPAERKDIERQFAYLSELSPERLAKEMAAFHSSAPHGGSRQGWIGSTRRPYLPSS